MPVRPILIAAAIIAAAVAAPAQATDPVLAPVPTTAAKMTLKIVTDTTWNTARLERFDEKAWPDGARVTLSTCKVVDRRHGRCRYDIDHFAEDNTHKTCGRRVYVRITKRTHRVRSRRVSLGCETT